MSEETKTTESAAPTLHVAPSPHVQDVHLTTRRMMLDVLIGLSPVMIAAMFFYRWYALQQILICVFSCCVAEALFTKMRRQKSQLWDLSAIVTGVILALSIPWNTPWFVAMIGSFAAIGLGKVIFGGLGMNLFNPAMVGRAFIMFAFTWALGAPGYINNGLMSVDENSGNEIMVSMNEAFGGQEAADALSGATPLTASKDGHKNVPLLSVVVGSVYSSLGERGIFVLLGGLWLLFRRTIAWQIPAGATLALVVVCLIRDIMGVSENWYTLHQLFSGAFFLGALFILTDPVTSPVTPKGRWIFGIGFGLLVMLIRLLSNYPEGVMFSVLLMNSLVPLINKWTVPKPFGGPVPARN